MQYSIWTDGSSSMERGAASSACLILSETHFITCKTKKFDGNKSSTYAEAMAIGLALASVYPILKEGDVVRIYTDSIHCYNAIRSITKNIEKYYSGFAGIKKAQHYIRQASQKGVQFKAFKVKAHKNKVLTPNRIVDLLARRTMRY